jgi:acyl phosphate:glycerol-3-phosphate acyltransferase
MWPAVIFIIAAYLIGAIPTGYIIAKRLMGIDIRQHGSGNIGATNVKRVVGKKAGLATLALDFLKGFIPVLAAVILFPRTVDPYQAVPVLAAVAAIIGHSRSIFLGFGGGKSVITSLGAILVLEPMAALIVAIIAVSTMRITRYVSVGSMLGAILAPVIVWILGGPLSHILLALFIGLYIIYLHRGNIQRLLKHQENRI